MHKKGLETYNDLIKIFILLLCISIRQDKEIELAIIRLQLVQVHVYTSTSCSNNYTSYFNNNSISAGLPKF